MQTADTTSGRLSGTSAHLHARRSETFRYHAGQPARYQTNLRHRSARHMARRRSGELLRAYFFFFGASTMIIWRPSIFGICST
jgi:hypothetical protein